MAANAFPQEHHARSIGWRVEAHDEGQHASGKCVEENRQPRTAEVPARAGANDLHIQLGMVDMTDLKGPLTMPRRGQVQFQVGRCELICRPAATPFEHEIALKPAVDGGRKGLVARRHGSYGFTGANKRTIHVEFPLCLRVS